MNEKEQDLGELDLEDILREFGEGSDILTDDEDEAAHSLTDALEEPEEELREDAEEQPEEIPEEPAVEEATEDGAEEEEDDVPVNDPEELPEEDLDLSGDTIRIDDELPETEAEEPQSEEELPEQEPEEAQPETEYKPREPIIFHPRSRLRELKRQLIAGPEKRYYELTEMGLGKLQVAIIVCLVVILLSVAAGALYAQGMIGENRMRLMVFGQILAMFVGALMGYNQLMDGIGDLFHGRFTLNTMLALTFVACVIDGCFCLAEQRVPICAAFTLEVTMSLWSTYQRRNTEMGQMDTMRKAIRLDSVVKVEDYYDGKPGILRGEGQVDDFMDHYTELADPEKKLNRFALVSLILSAAIAVVAGILNSVSMAFQIFSTSLLVAVPASTFVAVSRPMAVLERRLHSLGTVLCGWSGVKALSQKKIAYPLDDNDIFPVGSVKLNGVKFYGDRDPEVTIAYATALICANGGGLVPIFRQLLESRSGPKYPVKNFHIYSAGGIGGEVCGEPVIMGTLQFLQDMGVEIPAGTMVNQAVYVSIDGEFSGLFAITYSRMKYSASGMATLCAYRGLTPVALADDFILSGSFLKEKFGVNTRRMAFPTREEKAEMFAKEIPEETPVLALTTHDGLAPAAYAVTGARALRTACKLGVVIHIVGGILGLLIMLALAVIGGVELLTPLNILLYQLVWMVPALLVTEWTRTI